MENSIINNNEHSSKYQSSIKVSDTNFLDNYSINNVSYTSDDFVYSPLRCHYPSSYIPSDENKNTQCIGIEKQTRDNNNMKKYNNNNSNNNNDSEINYGKKNLNISRNSIQDNRIEQNTKNPKEILQNNRNEKINTLFSNTKNIDNSTIEKETEDNSIFSFASIPSISSFSISSSEETTSTIKRIYKNYMDSISIDSPSKLSNESFLKYIETPVFEKAKILFPTKEGKMDDEERSHDMYETPISSSSSSINKYKLYYQDTEKDGKPKNHFSTSSFLSNQNSEDVGEMNTISTSKDIMVTSKGKHVRSSSFKNKIDTIDNIHMESNHTPLKNSNENTQDKLKLNQSDRRQRTRSKSNKSSNLFDAYSLTPKHTTMPSFINEVTSKFDSEIKFIKENPIFISNISSSLRDPSKYTSNETSMISIENEFNEEPLENINLDHEHLEKISPFRQNPSYRNKKENYNISNDNSDNNNKDKSKSKSKITYSSTSISPIMSPSYSQKKNKNNIINNKNEYFLSSLSIDLQSTMKRSETFQKNYNSYTANENDALLEDISSTPKFNPKRTIQTKKVELDQWDSNKNRNFHNKNDNDNKNKNITNGEVNNGGNADDIDKSFQIIGSSASFEDFLLDSQKLIKSPHEINTIRDTNSIQESYQDNSNINFESYQKFSSPHHNKNRNNSNNNNNNNNNNQQYKDNDHDEDTYYNLKHFNINEYNKTQKSFSDSVDNNSILDPQFSIDRNSSFYSFHSSLLDEDVDNLFSVQKNKINSYETIKYTTNTNTNRFKSIKRRFSECSLSKPQKVPNR
jgi:hypothetical protein